MADVPEGRRRLAGGKRAQRAAPGPEPPKSTRAPAGAQEKPALSISLPYSKERSRRWPNCADAKPTRSSRAAPANTVPPPPPPPPLLEILAEELDHSVRHLANEDGTKPYFLS